MKKNRFEVVKIKENNDRIAIFDNYFKVLYFMDKIGDVNDISNMLNIANNVLGSEFEATYEDSL